MKTRELVKLTKEDGWYFVRQGGTSHMIYHHENKSGIVVVPNHGMNQDVPVGLANAILKQAGLKWPTLTITAMQYVAVIEQAEDGGFAAYVPDLPVCFTVGQTLEEVRLNIKEAIQVYVDEAKRVGLTLPDPRKLELVEVDF